MKKLACLIIAVFVANFAATAQVSNDIANMYYSVIAQMQPSLPITVDSDTHIIDVNYYKNTNIFEYVYELQSEFPPNLLAGTFAILGQSIADNLQKLVDGNVSMFVYAKKHNTRIRYTYFSKSGDRLKSITYNLSDYSYTYN